jgi:hypothetical protein
MSGQAALIESGIALLARSRNADGGWGAVPGGISDTESTALAALATGVVSGAEAARPACAWLSAHQRSDGAWPLSEVVPEAPWVTAPATAALAWLRADPPSVERGLDWLSSTEGARPTLLQRALGWLGVPPLVDLDYELIGWPWVPGTFSWVEPTSLALIAFKSAGGAGSDAARKRVDGGERMLLDRACTAGGWNYGNRSVLGFDLEPYPDTTALALLALQDHARDIAPIQSGLAALDRMLQTHDSGLALALGVLCGRAYGGDVKALAGRLERRFAESAFLEETRPVALAVLAASEAPNPFLFRAHA